MRFYCLVILILFFQSFSYSQGCSDAGFCTLESFQANIEDSSVTQYSNTIKIGESIGLGAKNIIANANYIDYGRKIGENVKINLKLTSLFQTGSSINSFGISDIFVNSSFKLSDYFNTTLGVKIPLSNGNKKQNEISLPMDFQSSLGTYDLIFGIGLNIKKFVISMAIQHPLTKNENEFISTNYPLNSFLSEFQTTNNYKRFADLLLSVSKPFNLSEKIVFTPNLLPIYHIKNDTYTNFLNQETEINGSKGLTFNINLYLDYKINQKNSIQINAGAPMVARKARPEGLTRSAVINLEYSRKF